MQSDLHTLSYFTSIVTLWDGIISVLCGGTEKLRCKLESGRARTHMETCLSLVTVQTTPVNTSARQLCWKQLYTSLHLEHWISQTKQNHY